jgi:hypothetical protein
MGMIVAFHAGESAVLPVMRKSARAVSAHSGNRLSGSSANFLTMWDGLINLTTRRMSIKC